MDTVGWLVYAGSQKRSRRSRQDWDWQGNVGSLVIIDALERAGIKVEHLPPERADRHQLVLASLTSTFDTWNLLEAAERIPQAAKLVLGGPGLININPLRHIAAAAVFGRGESVVPDLVRAMLDGGRLDHPAVMYPPEITPVVLQQAEALYPYEIETPIYGAWRERMLGCPLACGFCHYRWARKHVRTDGHYSPANDWSYQVTWGDLTEERFLSGWNGGRVLSAIDGSSERLRLAFNKRITDEQITETVARLAGHRHPARLSMRIYNVVNYPSEGEEDYAALRAALQAITAKVQAHLVLHSTPFRPMPLTPSAILPARIDRHPLGGSVLLETPSVKVCTSWGQEGQWSHLMDLVALRAGPEHDPIVADVLAIGRKPARQRRKVQALRKRHDLSPFLQAYVAHEELPTAYLSSYTPAASLQHASEKLCKVLA